MMILHHQASHSPTDLHRQFPFKPLPLLPAPPKRLALPAPKIAGYLPASASLTIVARAPIKRVVVAEIVDPLDLIDIRRDPDGWWAEFERIYGPDKTIEELDAEIEAEFPGWLKMKESWS